MKDLQGKCRVALVQAEPVLFDKAAGLDKTMDLIRKAAENDPPDLIVFPELFIPGYPFGTVCTLLFFTLHLLVIIT